MFRRRVSFLVYRTSNYCSELDLLVNYVEVVIYCKGRGGAAAAAGRERERRREREGERERVAALGRCPCPRSLACNNRAADDPANGIAADEIGGGIGGGVDGVEPTRPRAGVSATNVRLQEQVVRPCEGARATAARATAARATAARATE